MVRRSARSARVHRCSACPAPGVGAGCDNVAVPTSTDGWYPPARSRRRTSWIRCRFGNGTPSRCSKAVARHDAMISPEVVAAGGTLVRSKGEGDSTFSVFAHPAEAVAAAVAIQGTVARREVADGCSRCGCAKGLHTGDAEPRDGDWYGPAVNRAARLRARADGGQTLLSGVTAGLVAEHTPRRRAFAVSGSASTAGHRAARGSVGARRGRRPENGGPEAGEGWRSATRRYALRGAGGGACDA